MNKLVPGALYDPRHSKEQRMRSAARGEVPVGQPRDIRIYETSWDRAAEGFMEYDPDGSKLAKLFKKI